MILVAFQPLKLNCLLVHMYYMKAVHTIKFKSLQRINNITIHLLQTILLWWKFKEKFSSVKMWSQSSLQLKKYLINQRFNWVILMVLAKKLNLFWKIVFVSAGWGRLSVRSQISANFRCYSDYSLWLLNRKMIYSFILIGWRRVATSITIDQLKIGFNGKL